METIKVKIYSDSVECKLKNRRIITYALDNNEFGIVIKKLTAEEEPPFQFIRKRGISTIKLRLTEEAARSLRYALGETLNLNP